jgi:hypothetical protein
MAVQLNDNIYVRAGKPIDFKFGPFNSIEHANQSIPIEERYTGLIFGVYSNPLNIPNSNIIYYYYSNDLTDLNITELRSIAFNGNSSQFLKGDGSLDSNIYSLSGHVHSYLDITNLNEYTGFDSRYQISSQKGQINGYASLDETGKVPSSQLPSYVDDVLEFPNFISFPISGSTGIIYIALDTNRTYRWSGSTYLEISPSDVTQVFGRVGNISAEENDYLLYYPTLSQSYDNPSWINSLSWSKINNTPTTLSGYSITNAYTEEEINNFFSGSTPISGYNNVNWNSAYDGKINSAAVTGTTTKTLTLTRQDGDTITASWTDINTDAVTSVFGRIGAVIATNGDYNTSQVTENINLYYTEERVNANINVAANTAARHDAVTLGTANGLSLSTQQLSLGLASAGVTGALSGTDWSTFNNKVSSQWITSGSNIYYNTGSVLIGTSTNPTPVLGVSFPLVIQSSATTRIQINSTQAIPNAGVGLYANGVQKFSFAMFGLTSDFTIYNDALLASSLLVKGDTNRILIGTSTDGGQRLQVAGNFALRATATASTTTHIPVFVSDPSGNTRELFTRNPAQFRGDIGAGTVTSVAAITLGTTGTDLSSTVVNGSTTPVITLNVPTASAVNRGVLSAADWTTFNNKQNALTNPVTGTGVAGQVALWNGTTSQTGSVNLTWDSLNNRLDVTGNIKATGTLEIDTINNGIGDFLTNDINGILTRRTASEVLLDINAVPYTGATKNVNLGEYGISAGYFKYDTTPTNIPQDQGITYWDIDDNTVSIIMNGTILKVGEDQYYPVKNQTGSLIPKGTNVRFAGTVGNSGRLLIAPFIANGTFPSSYYMGITSEDIANGEDGKVMWFGRIRDINTNSYNEGDILYVSTTVAGGFQTTLPVAPNNIIQVAAVITKSINQGTIFVRPQIGSNINNDEGVRIVSGTTGQLLQLQSNGLWENKSLSTILGGTSSQFIKGDGTLDNISYQPTLTLTTTGNSGSPTLTGTTLNIPTYTLSGLGGIGGTGTSGQVAFWNGSTSQAGSANFIWDNINNKLDITGDIKATGTLEVDTINNGVGDFATISGAGVITRRTASQTLDDIGASSVTQVTPVTVLASSFALVGEFYEASIEDEAILATSIVDVIPSNASFTIVRDAQFLPETDSSIGSVKIYCVNLPAGDITVTLNITNT